MHNIFHISNICSKTLLGMGSFFCIMKCDNQALVDIPNTTSDTSYKVLASTAR